MQSPMSQFMRYSSRDCAGSILLAYSWRAETPIAVSSGIVSLTHFFLAPWNEISMNSSFGLITGDLLGAGGIWNCWWEVHCFVYRWKVMWRRRGKFQWRNCQGNFFIIFFFLHRRFSLALSVCLVLLWHVVFTDTKAHLPATFHTLYVYKFTNTVLLCSLQAYAITAIMKIYAFEISAGRKVDLLPEVSISFPLANAVWRSDLWTLSQSSSTMYLV